MFKLLYLKSVPFSIWAAWYVQLRHPKYHDMQQLKDKHKPLYFLTVS